MKSNVEIIRETIEQVVNQKKIEKWDDYFSQSYIARGAPYIGLGFSVNSSKGKPIIDNIASGSPSDGILQVGDELLWGEHEDQHWTTYKNISQGISQGHQGSKYKLGVQRGDKDLEFEVTKGLFRAFDTNCEQAKSDMREFMTKEIPDLTANIQLILAEADMVVCLLEYQGTHANYGLQAVWREAWFVRLSEGMIVESWPVNDESAYLRQIGFQLIPPSI